jgi:hypothetical protein
MRILERGPGYARRECGACVTINQNRRNKSHTASAEGVGSSVLGRDCLNVRCIGYLMNRLSAQAFLKPDEELSPLPGKKMVASYASRRWCLARRTPFLGSENEAIRLEWQPPESRARSIPGRDAAEERTPPPLSRLYTHAAPYRP